MILLNGIESVFWSRCYDDRRVMYACLMTMLMALRTLSLLPFFLFSFLSLFLFLLSFHFHFLFLLFVARRMTHFCVVDIPYQD